MPKVIELTIEINIQKVSCPGVWLCQDGRVSLTVFALGTSYQTCLLPPTFPLMFRDIFYFKKRFQESCALNNISCLLKDETIYCELVQWCNSCATGECVILAQYLGALNDVLFPPNMCSNDGVDLLMRRSKNFPGILSPKIEIATKVRIDEVWSIGCNMFGSSKAKRCECCPDPEAYRQKQVCHSAQYHRNKCKKGRRRSRSRSISRSGGSRSCCSLNNDDVNVSCLCPNPATISRSNLQNPAAALRGRKPCRRYNVYNVNTSSNVWAGNPQAPTVESQNIRSEKDGLLSASEERIQKLLLESCYIDPLDTHTDKKRYDHKPFPCVCEICKRYHEIFHS